MCVDRMALTLTSPDDQTTCGSLFGSKVITLTNSAGPPERRSLSSECRWAISPDCKYASPMCATNFLQLMVNPNCDTASALPIRPLLKNHAFGPDEICVLTTAFEDTLRTLRLANRGDPVTEIIARKIIELAQQGERDPVQLRERAIDFLSRWVGG